MKKYKVALLGLGTVGSGVIRVLESHKRRIASQVNAEFEVVGILVQSLHKVRSVQVNPALLTADFNEILSHDADIVIDAMGGLDPAFSYCKQALEHGCHLISANKDLLAKEGHFLHKLAEQKGVSLLYEASVGGGIPILNTLNHLLQANHVTRVHGILNGTTNYILTKMEEENLSYEAVLKRAQELGFAEANPSSDVEGLDALNKIRIISRLCFGVETAEKDVSCEGITSITQEEIQLYGKLGYRAKLIATGEKTPQGLYNRVRPALIPFAHPLAAVRDEFNGVFVSGDIVGDLFFTGKGAGALPTGSAIVEDLLNVVRGLRFEPHPEGEGQLVSSSPDNEESIAAVFRLSSENYEHSKTQLLSFLSTQAGYLHAVDTHAGERHGYVGAIISSPEMDAIQMEAARLHAEVSIREVLDESLVEAESYASAALV
ncbi:homoserine dehydrogenase [Aneurinibacillus sp. Ricciae_BoGa-3]|uniref:homoserine dehydrogenase n=1 Tax=Aneurinibacillus sp. Ricciae_BoGa-3 TaxID=3022697 RepID=UPI002340EB92|nr:homoserine dehydrogenase [Aneurinibacillus sp. Ricciae_BoGa-3]WCK52483.1 homoserine dehydrogenase [Aneurinibacillus sp. Ricciae_BoGa-3]